MDIKITGITLLTAEEAKDLPQKIRNINRNWWLCSPGSHDYFATCVSGGSGRVYAHGDYVNNLLGVRPALILDPESSDLKIGDKFKLAEQNWTVISEKYALCDDVIGNSVFRKNYNVPNANNYECSDIKKYIENWAKELEIKK